MYSSELGSYKAPRLLPRGTQFDSDLQIPTISLRQSDDQRRLNHPERCSGWFRHNLCVQRCEVRRQRATHRLQGWRVHGEFEQHDG